MKGMSTNMLIMLILAILVAVTIFALFPQIKKIATTSWPFGEKGISDLSSSDQSKIENTFNQFTANMEKCLNNGKANCVCKDIFSDYPSVFRPDIRGMVTIEISSNKELSKTYFNLSLGKSRGIISKELAGYAYIVNNKGEELSFNPKVGILPIWMTGWQTENAFLKIDSKRIIFESYPKMIIDNKDYGNPEINIKSAGIYKPSFNILDFMKEEVNAPAC